LPAGFWEQACGHSRCKAAFPNRENAQMKNGHFGLILGGVVALVAAIFIFSGGTLGGKTTISGDEDLPPIATADPD